MESVGLCLYLFLLVSPMLCHGAPNRTIIKNVPVDDQCVQDMKIRFPEYVGRFSEQLLLGSCQKSRVWQEDAMKGQPISETESILTPNQLEYFNSVSSCKGLQCLCDRWKACKKLEHYFKLMKEQSVSNFGEIDRKLNDGDPALFKLRKKRQTMNNLNLNSKLDSQVNLLQKFGKVTRKEIRSMTEMERQKLFAAFNTLKTEKIDGLTKYDILIIYHTPEYAPGAHFGAAFLPFHREFLKNVEMALRLVDPSVSLPYWDSTLDSILPTPADSILWTDEFLGNGNGEVTSGPFANWTTVPDKQIPDLSPKKKIVRAVGQSPFGSPFRESDIQALLSKPNFRNLVFCVDPFFELVHGANHMFVGGHMVELRISPNDPTFFLIHGWVDNLWEMWRRANQNAQDREIEFVNANETCNNFSHIDSPLKPYQASLKEGLSNKYLDEFYSYAPRPTCSGQNPTCQNAPYLFCDVTNGRCMSKIRPNGNCTGYDGKDICYKSSCIQGKCVPSNLPNTTTPAIGHPTTPGTMPTGNRTTVRTVTNEMGSIPTEPVDPVTAQPMPTEDTENISLDTGLASIPTTPVDSSNGHVTQSPLSTAEQDNNTPTQPPVEMTSSNPAMIPSAEPMPTTSQSPMTIPDLILTFIPSNVTSGPVSINNTIPGVDPSSVGQISEEPSVASVVPDITTPIIPIVPEPGPPTSEPIPGLPGTEDGSLPQFSQDPIDPVDSNQSYYGSSQMGNTGYVESSTTLHPLVTMAGSNGTMPVEVTIGPVDITFGTVGATSPDAPFGDSTYGTNDTNTEAETSTTLVVIPEVTIDSNSFTSGNSTLAMGTSTMALGHDNTTNRETYPAGVESTTPMMPFEVPESENGTSAYPAEVISPSTPPDVTMAGQNNTYAHGTYPSGEKITTPVSPPDVTVAGDNNTYAHGTYPSGEKITTPVSPPDVTVAGDNNTYGHGTYPSGQKTTTPASPPEASTSATQPASYSGVTNGPVILNATYSALMPADHTASGSPETVWFPMTVLVAQNGDKPVSYPKAKIVTTTSDGKTYQGLIGNRTDQPYYEGAAYGQVPSPISTGGAVTGNITVFDEFGKPCSSTCLKSGYTYEPCQPSITLHTDPEKSDKIPTTPTLAMAKLLTWKGYSRQMDKFMFICDTSSDTPSPGHYTGPPTGTAAVYNVPIGQGKYINVPVSGPNNVTHQKK